MTIASKYRPLLIVLLLLCWPGAVLAQQTAGIFAQWKDRLVQVQVIDRQAGTKAGIGSGFFAGQPGWIVTNYHVISALVNEPGSYEVNFQSDDGQSGSLELLSVDAVHDLALMRAVGQERSPLELATDDPPRGSRLWSLGYPFDIGLTIVEGTYNGHLQKSLYEKLHFTGSINPGMSGGPTLNAQGEVVGVNVSTAGNQVSFLVPVKHVHALLERGIADQHDDDGINRLLTTQLLENQDQLTSRLLGNDMPVTRLNHYEVPAGFGDLVSCWGNSEVDDENRLSLVYYRCQTQDDIYLSSSLNTGIVQYQHDLVSTDELGPLRFYRQLEKRNYYPSLRLDGDETSVTNYDCQSGFVDENELPLKVTYCVRAYRKVDGLYDAFLSATSLVGDKEALQSTLVLGGFSWENLDRFVTRFLETFSWKE